MELHFFTLFRKELTFVHLLTYRSFSWRQKAIASSYFISTKQMSAPNKKNSPQAVFFRYKLANQYPKILLAKAGF
ncbi:hypothetical protein [uncultured Flavobacterium sp.]|uniref:hypothetical protein n=1 Tax=uncultured Flavobacterium sp. TaxID=165435 RepID=UPI0025F3C3A7|nr:hypothetical protein [uncultured Flavobacterium sp.]